MLNKTIDLLYQAKQQGIEIVLNEDRLNLRLPKNKNVDQVLLGEIKANKQAIIDFLKTNKSSDTRGGIIRFDRNEIKNVPLSFSQERLWFIDRLSGSVEYNLPTVLRLKGNLNVEALQLAFQTVIDRHEILRSTYYEENGQPYQLVKEKNQWKLSIVDGSKYIADKTPLSSFVQSMVRKPFDLSADFMLRGNLIALDPIEHLLVVTLHHIAADGWSMSIIVKEVAHLYLSFLSRQDAQLEPLHLQYADYAVWQRNFLKGEALDQKLGYWKTKLANAQPLSLPTDFVRPSAHNTNGLVTQFAFDTKLSGDLHHFCQQQGVTMFMTLLAAFKVLLHKYSSHDDITVGTSIASRQQKEIENLVGFFVNTLALRTEVDVNSTFTQFLGRVKTTISEAYDHQEVPFEKVVNAVGEERDASRTPLFQVMLVWQSTPEAPAVQLGELELLNEEFVSNDSKFDFTFFMNGYGGHLKGAVQYRSDLYASTTIQRLTQHYQQLLRSIVSNPDQKVSELNMLAEEEVAELQTFNRDAVAYPKEKTVVTLFEEQAARTPGAPAVVSEGEVLSYKELNERSNRLAHYLRQRGVREDQAIPMCIERGAGMMVAMLGILKAGAGYVPIDTDFPSDRISYMLEDTAAAIVVSSKASSLKLPQGSAEVIQIDGGALDSQPVHNPTTGLQPHHLAYVIYTSGSTGQPKGVMIEHRNLVDYVFGLNQKTQIDQCKSYALVSTIATDLGNTVIYSSLLLGGALHVFSKEAVSNIEHLHEYFSAHRIDCLKIVPSHFKALSNEGALLLPGKLLVFGGEALPSEVIEDIRASGSLCRIVNHYGPTETTVGKLLHVVDRSATYNNTIPIGKPFSNTRVYVLSKTLQLCPIGVPGQLYIAGDGVARGYLNNADLTAAKFVEDPFDKQGQSLMYATGDQVKYLDKGEIEFIGRIDNQVKIRGYRVEPGEIESILQQCRGVRQGVVIAGKDKQGNNRLTGYIVPEGEFDREAITRQLKEKLPEYMIPAVLVELQSVPLTPNGKVDRKALPDPEAGEVLGDQYVAPRNEAEEQLARIWQDVLEVEQVGVHDDFFELGGHSLLAVRLISAIRKAFKVEMPISHVFDYPTVALLAGQLESQSTNVLPPIEVLQPRPEQIPLSFSQERLWFIDKLEGSVQYHVPAVLGLKGRLHTAALEFALKTIVNRHEVLRTVFTEQDGHASQQVKDNDQWQLSRVDGSEYKDDPKGLQEYIHQLISKPFDLSKDDMLRAALITLSEEEHVLVVTLHHIASDGWSRSILVREVAALYAAFEENRPVQLAPLPVQYADYALWQRQYLQGEVLESKLQYWKDKLQDTEPLQLPTDYTRPAVQTTKGASAHFRIEKELSTALNELSQQQGSTLFMTLLAVFKVLLYRYTGQKDICIGTPIAGRQQQELEGLIGFFLNTLALRTRLDGEQSFIELLREVRATTMEAYEHQDVPFEKVVETVVKERDPSRTPLFQSMFILQNTPEITQLTLGQLQLTEEKFDHDSAKFEITLSLKEIGKGLMGSFEYNEDLYGRATIDRMTAHFIELIKSIVQTPQQKIASLLMLTKAEENRLLVELNDTAVDFPNDKTLVSLFEEQVAKTPDSVAVIFEEQRLTYRELNERANKLAFYLQNKGVQPETPVPICIERGFEMIIGILGILKAGGVYVPIDPGYPAERIKYMLDDTAAKLVVTSKQSKTKLTALPSGEIVEVDAGSYNYEGAPLQIRQPPVFCIIYTSGSSGKSKGVKLTNAGIVNRMYWMWNSFPFGENEIGAIKTSISFVDHVWELFGTLTRGIPSVIFKQDDLLDIDALYEKLAADKITRWVLVPSLLKALLDKIHSEKLTLPNLKHWTCSGETLPLDLVKEFYNIFPATSHKLLNIYGSSEVTADVTYYDTSLDFINGDSFSDSNLGVQQVPIGKPISNCKIFILDTNNRLVPEGAIGEICVAGVQVAKGYLNRPELTAEKFITVPLADGTNERMYKTGDLGRWCPGGNIQYLGRLDTQVKIRGNRVELGEIENTLLNSGLVNQVVVLAKDDKEGAKALVAYVVAEEFDKKAVLSNLNERLPDYMVPAVWVELPHLPLLPNGKIDKKALPQPDAIEQLSKVYVAPRNEVEEKFAEIWQHLLKIERVGIEDNFFEIGGHSLLAMRVVSAIRKELQVELAIKDLFVHPTIKALADSIETQNKVLLPTIQVKPRPSKIPLSFSQERLWFIDKLDGTVQYHLPAIFRLKGNLNINALEHALRNIVDRHEVLRTVFLEEEGRAFQHIQDAEGWLLSVCDFRSSNTEAEIQSQIEEFARKPFNLVKDYMLRANLIIVEDNNFLLSVVLNHIAADGWSLHIIVKEVVELYTAFVEGHAGNLPVLPIHYADYAIWQREYLNGDILNNKIAYWQDKLQNVAPLQLPTDFPRPAVQSTRGATTTFQISKPVLDSLRAISRQEGATMFMTLLAAFKVLMHRYSGQQDICVGTSVANRQQQEVEDLIGFFVNNLALRSHVDGGETFIALVQQIRATVIGAYEHQDVPFEKVVEAVVEQRDMSRNPLFQVLFVLQNTPDVPVIDLKGVELSAGPFTHTTSQFDIICNLRETADGLNGAVEYCTDLYTEKTISKMFGHFSNLLTSIVAGPQQKLGQLQMLSSADEQQLLIDFNNTKAPIGLNKTVVDLFEEQALKSPNATALIFEGQRLTYSELNESANQLANCLQSKGVRAETLVPIFIERSVEMMVGLLGILKSGAAYVPIDPTYPIRRIEYMLEDIASKVAVSSQASSDKLPFITGLEVIEIDTPAIKRQPITNPETTIESHHPAYVIYTSGSTGNPKGVIVEHGSLTNYLVNNKTHYINEASGNTGSFIHLSYTFDASISGMFMPLIAGKSIVVGSKQSFQVFEDENLFRYAPYDFIKLTPAHLELLKPTMEDASAGWLTNKLVLGGEALHAGYFDYFVEKEIDVEIVNEYGPTEATVGCSTYSFYTLADVEKIRNGISIGRPIDNVQLYLVGQSSELVPVGVPGEICIGGAGLARGYLNQPGLTAEKFIENPFDKKDGSRIYRTGDLGKWALDGTIEYLGRIDDQVKIRGYRVELGEIESVLLQSELVSQAVVLAQADANGNKRLVGYVVAKDGFDKGAITGYLDARLPEYMVPALWVELKNLPLTSNGKVDKKALPAFDASEQKSKEFVSARNEIEAALVTIWEDLLGADQVGIHDNFFDLGGDSIVIIQVVSRARRVGYELEVADIFSYQTIAALSDFMEQKSKAKQQSIAEQGQLKGLSGLLPIQQWYLEKNQKHASHYNQAVLLGLNKDINELQLRTAIENLTNHHDVLRFKYYKKDGQWIQEYGADKGIVITEDLRSSSSELLSQKIEALAEKHQRSLNIESGELIRAILVQTPESEPANRLFIVIHHLAVDGVSWRILLEELELLLNNITIDKKVVLPQKTSSYREWYNELEKFGTSEKVLSQKKYWQQITKSYQQLIVDKEFVGEVRIGDTGKCVNRLNADSTRLLLLEVARVYRTNINDILLGALAKTLTEWSGLTKVVVGLEGHGRENISKNVDLTRTVGWFTTLYPVLLTVEAGTKDDELIKSVKEQLRQVPEKGIGYGILKYINKEDFLQGSDPWDVVFNYLGQVDNIVNESKWFTGVSERIGANRSEENVVSEKLTVNGLVQGGELMFSWTYSTKHYNEETINGVSNAFIYNIQKLIDHCVGHKHSGSRTVYTPSDFGLGSDVSYDELDRFMEEEDNIDNILSF